MKNPDNNKNSKYITPHKPVSLIFCLLQAWFFMFRAVWQTVCCHRSWQRNLRSIYWSGSSRTIYIRPL